jgi:hypothetical protein
MKGQPVSPPILVIGLGFDSFERKGLLYGERLCNLMDQEDGQGWVEQALRTLERVQWVSLMIACLGKLRWAESRDHPHQAGLWSGPSKVFPGCVTR